MTKEQQNNQQSKGKQEIKISDNIPGGEYANAMQASHNKDEFQMMFLSIMGGSGKVVSKIMTSPGHFKRMALALQDNVKKYEEKFGEIEVSQGPKDKEIGFQG